MIASRATLMPASIWKNLAPVRGLLVTRASRSSRVIARSVTWLWHAAVKVRRLDSNERPPHSPKTSPGPNVVTVTSLPSMACWRATSPSTIT